jgi:hypothetical protein
MGSELGLAVCHNRRGEEILEFKVATGGKIVRFC